MSKYPISLCIFELEVGLSGDLPIVDFLGLLASES